MEVVRAVEKVGSQSGKTAQPVVIADCGQLSWCVRLVVLVCRVCQVPSFLSLTPSPPQNVIAVRPPLPECCGSCILRTRTAVTTRREV